MDKRLIIEEIKRDTEAIRLALTDLEAGKNEDFFKSLIQNKAIDIHTAISSLSLHDEKDTKPVTEKIVPEIKEETKVEVTKEKPEPEKKPIIQETAPQKEKPDEKVVETLKVEVKKEESLKIEVEESDDLSINEKISKTRTPVVNLVEKSKETPIADLSKAISISKKFEFINTLFDGDSAAYKNCLSTIQGAGNVDEAYQFLESEIVDKFEWDDNEKLAEEFFSLTRRRFLK